MIVPWSNAALDRTAIKRAGFPAFAEIELRQRHGSAYVHAKHIAPYARVLEALYHGEVLTCLTSLPPGAMKSEIGSGLFPAWIWSLDRKYKFMRASYTKDLAAKNARLTRDICRSQWYTDRWGAFLLDRIPGVPNGMGEYYTTERGMSLCSSIGGGGLTGYHAHMMIVDDPIPGQNTAAADPATLRQARDWYQSVAVTRGQIRFAQRMLVIAQRFHDQDLNGLLLEQETGESDFVHFMWPWHFDPKRAFRSRWGSDWRTVPGEELFDNPTQRRTVAKMLKAGRDNPRYLAQYQQDPETAASDIFPADTFLPLDGCPVFSECLTAITVDPTFNGKDKSDFMAIDVWGYRDGVFVCFYSEQAKRSFFDAVAAIKAVYAKWPALNIVIEKTANGEALKAMLEADGQGGVTLIDPQGQWAGTGDKSKEGRARMASFYFKSKAVHFDTQASWFAAKARAMQRFPYATHDDTVDAAVMGVLWLQFTHGGGTVFERAMRGVDKASEDETPEPAALIEQMRGFYGRRMRQEVGAPRAEQEMLESLGMAPDTFSGLEVSL